MARKSKQSQENPLKRENQRKATTRELADKSPPSPRRTPVSRTLTAQGGSKKPRGKPTNRHRSQRGGVKAGVD
jgi:hypothetical protein